METNFLDIKTLLGQFNRESYPMEGPFRTKLNSQVGQGEILQILAGAGIEGFLVNLSFKQDTILRVPVGGSDSLHLFYVLEGSCSYFNSEATRLVFFDRFQTNFIFSPDFMEGGVKVAGGQKIYFLSLELCPQRFVLDYPNYKNLLLELLKKVRNMDSFETRFFKVSHNLSICGQIKGLLRETPGSDRLDVLSSEIICKQVLARQLEQFRSGNNGGSNRSGLSIRETQQVVKLVEWIKASLGQLLSVTELCRRSGMSANKLQLGFKTMYGHTVSDYIRNLRLEKAEFLIRSTDLNISEVVYTVGLTSRSYFCKIFKRKYDCAPKQYKNMVWQQPVKKADLVDPLL